MRKRVLKRYLTLGGVLLVGSLLIGVTTPVYGDPNGNVGGGDGADVLGLPQQNTTPETPQGSGSIDPAGVGGSQSGSQSGAGFDPEGGGTAGTNVGSSNGGGSGSTGSGGSSGGGGSGGGTSGSSGGGSGFTTPSTDFVPLAGIPGLTTTSLNNLNLPGLLQTLYKLAITVGALIAVFQITLAGFKYMGSEVITSKEEAKNDISSSLLGLLIILSTALILKTISGDLSLDVFSGAPAVNMSSTQPPTTQPPSAGAAAAAQPPDPTDATGRGVLPPTPTASNSQCDTDARMVAMSCPQNKRVFQSAVIGCSCAP